MDAFANIDQPAGQELTLRAQQRAKEKQIDFRLALSEVRRESPGLSEQARQEAIAAPGQREGEVPGMFAGRPHSFEFHKKITARAAQKQIPYSAARGEIESEEPDLAARARSEGGMQIRDIMPLPDGAEMMVCATELGRTADPGGLLARAAENRSRKRGISYRLALSEVSRDYPKLAAAARRRTMGLGAL
jgi:hypothetical protein